MPRRLLRFLLLTVLLVALIQAALVIAVHRPGSMEKDKTLILLPGSGLRGIGDRLAEEGVVSSSLLFKLWAVEKGLAKQLKPGEYIFPARTSLNDVIRMIASGKTVIHRITVVEGMRTAEILAMIGKEPILSGEFPVEVAEGELLPETYYFSYGDTRAQLVGRMRKAMTALLENAWPKRKEGLPFDTMQQALTLASIVEKETGVAEERPRVAAVFINRLHKNMKLESDPTTQYAIERDKGLLKRSLILNDLTYDSPYNTYVAAALPPGPIANPGKASILAVLHPLETDELYFVADGSGGHRFASTLKEHNRNVVAWRAVQKAHRKAENPAGKQ